MRKYFYIIAIFALSLGMMSCQKNSDRIEELREFVEEFGEDSKKYTEDQLEKIDDKYSAMLEKLEDMDDLTPEEVKEIARIKGKYAAAVLKKSGESIMEKMDTAGKAIEGFLEGLDEE